MSRAAWTTLLVAVVALGIMVGALAAVLAGEDVPTANPTGSEVRGFELPLTNDPGALVLGRHDGNLLVGIAALRGGPVEIAALRAETPIATDSLQIALEGQEVEAESCGRGCSRVGASVLAGERQSLTVRHGPNSVSFGLPAQVPPDGDAVFERALRTMDSLRSYRFTERLSSGRAAIFTTIDVQAPNRLRLRTATGFASVIIGRRRWDFRGGKWEQSAFPGLDVREVLMWHEAENPRIVRRSKDGTLELAAFGLQPVPAWFRLEVAPSGRVVEAEMTAASHFMLHRYSDFDAGVKIEPPR